MQNSFEHWFISKSLKYGDLQKLVKRTGYSITTVKRFFREPEKLANFTHITIKSEAEKLANENQQSLINSVTNVTAEEELAKKFKLQKVEQ